METITVDFTGCKYIDEVHEVLKKTFDFPDYYGKNLDALWDCLRYYSHYPLLIEIKGLFSLPKEFDEYMGKMLEVFDDVHNETPHIEFKIIS